MGVIRLDERRRITLPSEVIDDAEQEFVAIKTGEGILLKPLPKDPIAALQKIGEKIPKNLTVADLRRIAQEEADKEVLEKLERLEKLRKHGKRVEK